jgi:hypothetical protein
VDLVEDDREGEEYWHEPRMRAARAMANARLRSDPAESADGDKVIVVLWL